MASLIRKLKRDKKNIDPRNCADCSTRSQSLMRKLLGKNKQIPLEQSEVENMYTALRITKEEKLECEKQLGNKTAELNYTIKERDNILNQLEIQRDANTELIETLGINKRDNRELETTRKCNDQLKAQNENLTKSLNEMKNEKENLTKSLNEMKIENGKLTEELKLQEQKYESSMTEIEELKNKIKEAENESQITVNDLIREIEELKTKMKTTEGENERKVNELQNEIKELKTKATISESESEPTVNKLQKEVTALRGSLSSKNTEIADIKRQNIKHVDNTTQTEEKNSEIQMLNDKIKSLKSELETKETEKQKIDNLNKDLKEQLERSDAKLKLEKDEETAQINSLKSKCIELETERNMLIASKKSLQNHIDEIKKDRMRLNTENSKFEQEVKSQQINLDVITREKNQLKTDVVDKEKVVEELKTLKAVLTSELELSKKENEKLVQQIEQLTKKPRRLIELNVVSSMKQGLTDIVMHDLNRKLKQISDTDDTDIVLRPTAPSTATAPPTPATGTAANVKGPTVVFCISISRLGSDVQEALKGISVSSDVAIIIFHHKEAHALPSQSSEKILTGSEYKQLGSIIDMAVLSSKGIYNCDMNNLGFTKLVSFAKRFMN